MMVSVLIAFALSRSLSPCGFANNDDDEDAIPSWRRRRWWAARLTLTVSEHIIYLCTFVLLTMPWCDQFTWVIRIHSSLFCLLIIVYSARVAVSLTSSWSSWRFFLLFLGNPSFITRTWVLLVMRQVALSSYCWLHNGWILLMSLYVFRGW